MSLTIIYPGCVLAQNTLVIVYVYTKGILKTFLTCLPFTQGNSLSEILLDSDTDEDSDYEVRPAPALPVYVRVLMLFLISWQAFFTVSHAGLAMMVVFLYHFFRVLFLFENTSDILKCFVKFWPKSPTGLHQSLNIQLDKFKQFVVCPSCHCIYDYDHCITATKQVRKCQFIAFPNHPRQSKRSPCGTPLLDRKKTQNGYL